jgi:hypothetical protein
MQKTRTDTMIHLTLTDHYKIHKIAQFINVEKRLRNKKNIFFRLLHRVCVRRIKKIDEGYFHPRVIEVATQEEVDYLAISKLSEIHYKYFRFFKEILHGNFKNHSNN